MIFSHYFSNEVRLELAISTLPLSRVSLYAETLVSLFVAICDM